MPPVEELHWFDTEVRPCEPALRAYLHKRFPALSDHDDLVQEAYVRLLRARREGRVTSAKAFLFTVTRNLAIDMFRHRRRSSTHEPISDVVDQPALEEPVDFIAASEHQRRLDILLEAVVALPERCRMVMMLRHLDGLSYKEIAEQLGISANTVRVHMVKGVKDCTAFFRQQGLLDDVVGAGSAACEEEKAS
jgi:RNA polymerase sigma factor (sigma-70 family)